MAVYTRTLPALTFAVLLGCSPSTVYTPAASTTYPARKPQCSFRVVTNHTKVPFKRVGVIDIASFHIGGLPSTETEFRTAVAEQVCKAGGHAVIPAISGTGRYIHGTVIRFPCRDATSKNTPKTTATASAGDAGQSKSTPESTATTDENPGVVPPSSPPAIEGATEAGNDAGDESQAQPAEDTTTNSDATVNSEAPQE